MNLTLWIVAAVLAAVFLASGVLKLVRSPDQLADAGLAWARDFSPATVKMIGVAELLAAIGLVLPAALGIAPVLVPLAALGLVLLMAGATVTHVRRHETPAVAVNLLLLALAGVVALGRFAGS